MQNSGLQRALMKGDALCLGMSWIQLGWARLAHLETTSSAEQQLLHCWAWPAWPPPAVATLRAAQAKALPGLDAWACAPCWSRQQPQQSTRLMLRVVDSPNELHQ